MEVMARLLERGDREVIALVRAPDDAAAQERLDGILAKLWRRPVAVPRRARARSRATSRRPGLGHGRRARARAVAEEAGAVMHCAASISFDLPLDEARQINVEGTREIIGFAREAKNGGRLDRFIHVSTAYVAGITEGTFRERQLDAGQEFRNTYEQTKWEAEHVVNDASDLNPVIARPVDRDGRVRVGLDAGLQRPVLADPGVLARALQPRSRRARRRWWTSCPVDYVADALVHLLEDSSSSGVVNLVSGREACTVDELVGDDVRARSARSARPSSPRARPARAPPTPTTRPRCTSRTSTWTWSSTTRAPARCSGRRGSSART